MARNYVVCLTELLKTGKYSEEDLELLNYGNIAEFSHYHDEYASVQEFLADDASWEEKLRRREARAREQKEAEIAKGLPKGIGQIYEALPSEHRGQFLENLEEHEYYVADLGPLVECPQILSTRSKKLNLVELMLVKKLIECVSGEIVGGLGVREKIAALPTDQMTWILLSLGSKYYFVPLYVFLSTDYFSNKIAGFPVVSFEFWVKGNVIFFLLKDPDTEMYPKIPDEVWFLRSNRHGLLDLDTLCPIEKFLTQNGFSNVSDVYPRFWRLPMIVAEGLVEER
jgi:hypothetical protein